MTMRTVDWTAPRAPGTAAAEAEGLRERKKRLMRQQLSDTATQMFMDRGFDAVRVTEIAEACGVSEKTVFNYFPTKESLLLDRLEATVSSLRTGLADPDRPFDLGLHLNLSEHFSAEPEGYGLRGLILRAYAGRLLQRGLARHRPAPDLL